MAKEDRQAAEAVDKVLDKMIKRVETWWVTETAKEARKAEQAEARAVAKAAKAAERAAAKAQVRVRLLAVAWWAVWARQASMQNWVQNLVGWCLSRVFWVTETANEARSGPTHPNGQL